MTVKFKLLVFGIRMLSKWDTCPLPFVKERDVYHTFLHLDDWLGHRFGCRMLYWHCIGLEGGGGKANSFMT